MRRLAVVLAVAGLNALSAPAIAAEHRAKPGVVAEAAAKDDPIFERLGADFVKAGNSDALSIAVVRDGKARFYNFGSVSRDTPRAPTQDTVYEIGSISKILTALILANAVGEGKVDPQDDIRRYLPGEYPQLEFAGAPVRLIHLVNTTSALPDNLPVLPPQIEEAGPDKAPFLAVDALRRVTDAQVFAELGSARLLDRPGTSPRHSNLAANLLGDILEKVYDAPYESLLTRYVERPFGMGAGTGDTRSSLVATGYSKTHVAMPALDARSVLAAGGLRYSAADMARFLVAELAASDASVRLSQKPAWGDPDNLAVGYNWTVSKTVDDQTWLRASGGTYGFSSYIELYPQRGYGIVLLANRPGEAQGQLQDLASQAAEAVWGRPPVLAKLESALQASAYRDVGRTVAEVGKAFPELRLTEEHANQWGYRLLGEDKPQLALGMFRYNTERWPQSWNAFDSLAECYELLGDVANATSHYRRSLELNPANSNAVEHLRKLDPAQAPAAAGAK